MIHQKGGEGREENDCRNYFIINLHKSMGPGQDRTRNPWICSQTSICCQTRSSCVCDLAREGLPVGLILLSYLVVYTVESLSLFISLLHLYLYVLEDDTSIS